MPVGKRARDNSDTGPSKLAKARTGTDVAASRARQGAVPKGADADGNAYWELSKMRRIGISQFRGSVYVSIREYYKSDGQMRPGKKGISLSLEQYQTLAKAIPEINAELRAVGELSDADDDADAAASTDNGDKASPAKADKSKVDKPKAKKSNIEETSDEDED